MGTSAWAKSVVWSEIFESATTETLQSAWTKNNDATWGATYSPHLELANNSYGNSTKYLFAYDNTTNRQRTAYYMFGSAYTGTAYQLDAKINLNVGNSSGESRFYVMNGAKAGTNSDPSNYLFYIGGNTSGYVYVSNGTDTETSTIGNAGTSENLSQYQSKSYKSTGWFNVSCIIDMTAGKVKVTITKGSSEETFTINLKSGTKQISGFGIRTGKALGGSVGLDDMTLYSLVPPAFTLSENSKTVSVSGSETVNVTDITGDVSVVSNNTSVATASYTAGTITINGVASGVTTLTVTGTNDGVTMEKNIDVTVGEVATTTVTVNYLCGGSPIASAATIENITIGSTLTLSDITYSETIAGVGCRYANPTFSVSFPYTVVEDGVIDISYTQQNSVSTLNIYGNVAGNNYLLHTYALDGKYVGDAVAVTYPEYYLLDGTIYSTANKQFSGSDYYSGSFTLTGTDPVLTYNSVESNVVYFSDAENIVGGTENASGNANIRCSDAKGAYFASATNVVTLPAGRYTIHTQVWGGHNTDDSKNVDFTFNDGTSDFYVHRTTGALNPKSQEFTLTSTATITVTGGASGKVLDLVYIVKTGEVATITSAGWSTLFTPYALDFSGVAGLTAYTATCDGTTVTLTPVENVPANTGVVLKGAANDYNIPVIASSSTAQGDLKGSATDAKAYDESYNYYYLAMNGANAQFKKLTSGSIAAGKAYLQLDKATPARELSVSFEEDVTAISSVELSQDKMQNEFFDLQGRRVAQPTKGLYIVNGKKIIIK